MGNFSDKLSKRIKHVGRKKPGYCLICGMHGKLTIDHVPPQGSVIVGPVEQRHVVESMNGVEPGLKGIASPNGSKFKTICSDCNSRLLGGLFDPEICRFYRELATYVVEDANKDALQSSYTIPVNLEPFLRGMVGHIISATSELECDTHPVSSSYWDPLVRFVLNGGADVHLTHDFYVWFYPWRRHISAKFVGFNTNGQISSLSLLSFFPMAFLVVEKGGSLSLPVGAYKIAEDDAELTINITRESIREADFPFVELSTGTFYALSESQAIVTYPVKKS